MVPKLGLPSLGRAAKKKFGKLNICIPLKFLYNVCYIKSFKQPAKIINKRSRKEGRAMMKSKLFTTCALIAGTLLGSWSFPSFAVPHMEIHGNVRLDTIWMDKIPKWPNNLNAETYSGEPANLASGFGPGVGSAFPDVPQWSVPMNKVDGAFDQSQFLIDARYSRLYVTAEDCCCGVRMFGKIEFDFSTQEFGDFDDSRWAGGHHARLRLAYARADYCDFFLIAGQDWSKFQNIAIGVPYHDRNGMDLDIDKNGWAGWSKTRQPQVCVGYKLPVSICGCEAADLVLLAAIEKTFLTLAPFQGNGDCTSIDSGVNIGRVIGEPIQGGGFDLPLFVGKAGFYNYLPFQAEIAVAGTRNRVILADRVPNCPDNESLFPEGGQRHSSIHKHGAWAVQATVQSEFNNFTAYYQHLDGLQRFNNNEFPDATFAAGDNIRIPGEYDVFRPSLHNIRSNGWYVGGYYKTSFRACDDTVIGAIYGQDRARRINNSDFTPSAIYRVSEQEIAFDNSQTRVAQRLRSLNVSVTHNFWCDWQVGILYKRWDTKAFKADFRNNEDFDGFSIRSDAEKGHVSLVMASLWYIF